MTFEHRHENKSCSSCREWKFWKFSIFSKFSLKVLKVSKVFESFQSFHKFFWKFSLTFKLWNSWFPAFVWRPDIFLLDTPIYLLLHKILCYIHCSHKNYSIHCIYIVLYLSVYKVYIVDKVYQVTAAQSHFCKWYVYSYTIKTTLDGY